MADQVSLLHPHAGSKKQDNNRSKKHKVKLETSWKQHLMEEFSKPYFDQLIEFVKSEYKSNRVFPPGPQIFNAFDHSSFDKTKVVIIGQDPYHGESQAMGLSFSVPSNQKIPPSLQNVFKEIENDLEVQPKQSGDLTRWADQGVLLLNATLTVRAHQAGSHQGKGWEQFTDSVIQLINEQKEHVVFMLWGRFAQAKADFVDADKHLVLKAAHPSPFAAHKGFFGCKHFSKCNEYLHQHGKEPIDWS